jgi:FlaA1/EpsC-like NDP-sugar epimerase
MSATRFSPRTIGLISADAAILFSGVMLALYLRLGISGSTNELDTKNGWLKIALASVICLIAFYFYDLYDYIVMTNRRELLLRLVQSLGIAWVLLALLFYFVPPLLIGRGVSVLSVPIILALLLGWRSFIHQLTGHPSIGEKVLVVGTGQTALYTAEAVWERRDAGYRIVGFVSENGAKPKEKLGRSEIIGRATISKFRRSHYRKFQPVAGRVSPADGRCCNSGAAAQDPSRRQLVARSIYPEPGSAFLSQMV